MGGVLRLGTIVQGAKIPKNSYYILKESKILIVKCPAWSVNGTSILAVTGNGEHRIYSWKKAKKNAELKP